MRDVPIIQKLINDFAGEGKMLPVGLNQLYENLRDFWVYEEKSKVIACCRLHITWKNLGEIRSLAVAEKEQRQGIGNLLVKRVLKEAKELNLKKVFALTYMPSFFEKLGFCFKSQFAEPFIQNLINLTLLPCSLHKGFKSTKAIP